MNINQMKAIDHYLGVPICLLLDLHNFIKTFFARNKLKEPVKNILVIKLFGMGSIVLATPMLRELKKKFPQAKITFLTFSNNQEICELIDYIDRTICLRQTSFLPFFRDVIKLWLELRQIKFDISIDMEFFSKFSTIINYSSGAPIRVGFYLRQMWRGNLLTNEVYYNHYKHITDVFLALAKAVSDVTEQNTELIKLNPKDSDRETMQKLLAEHGVNLNSDKLLVMNVNSSDLALERRWDGKSFARLADVFAGKYKAKIIFMGGKSDTDYVNGVIETMANKSYAINLAGKTSVGTLLALLEFSCLFITNDSGPLHLAVSLGVPTVSFFGPESPFLYGPPKNEKHTVFYKGLYCSPCLSVFNVKTAMCNGNNQCMKTIEFANVVATVEEKYFKNGKPGGNNLQMDTGDK